MILVETFSCIHNSYIYVVAMQLCQGEKANLTCHILNSSFFPIYGGGWHGGFYLSHLFRQIRNAKKERWKISLQQSTFYKSKTN